MTVQLTLRVAAPTRDPHVVARRYVLEAIRHVASHNAGVVSPNAVRELLTAVGADIPRGVAGATYRTLRRDGRLVPLGMERSDDTAGGNAGKWHETYRLADGGVA
jgi:hypothetical protein